jgi:hypothetical protein
MSPNWERVWRMSGIGFVLFAVVAYIVFGTQPKVGASADKLVSFYDGDRTRIMIAAVIFGFALLNLMWFGAALNAALRDAGRGGWGAAATAASTSLAAVLFVILAVDAALAYSIAGSGDSGLTSGLNDLTWVCSVLASFPMAMLVMASAFGLNRAGIISNALFGVGVAAVILVLLGATTWASSGFWAVDGAYSQYIAPIIALAWFVVVSALLSRSTATAQAPERMAVPAA